MKSHLQLLPFLLALSAAAAPPERVTVFQSGLDGYHTYRIPALVTTPKGTLLAFCEGRKDGPGDHGDVDLVLKRSTDGGAAWLPMQLLHEEGGAEKITIGNPCPVIDRQTGTIWLAFCRDNKDVFMTSSQDDGMTWAAPLDITASVKDAGWDWYATGPGHGIQLERGAKKGRLVFPCDHRAKEGEGGWKERGRSHVIYSDDHGQTWKRGGATGWAMNECEVVERADGSLLLSMRNYLNKNQRAFAVSQDGGETWSEPRHHEQVFCPTCQSSIQRVSLPPRNRLIYSGPGGPGRTNLTLRASFDDGDTWPAARLLHPGPAAYSDLAILPNGQIGCLYEGGKDNFREAIHFARFPLDWVLEWNSPTSAEPEHGHGLSAADAAAGWISLFDGKTAFGWKNAALSDGTLSGDAATAARFGDSTLRGIATVGGTLTVGAWSAPVAAGAFELKVSAAKAAPVQLSGGLTLSQLALRPDGMETILNGKDMAGWTEIRHPNKKAPNQAVWSVVEGAIHVTGGPGALEYPKLYGDFILQVEVRAGKLSNGGVFTRSIPGDFMNGYETQIFNACYGGDPSHPVVYSTGSLDDRQLARRLVSRDGEWFTMTIVAHGPHLATWVNGYQTTDWTDTRFPDENPRKGSRVKPGVIQIQAHDPETNQFIKSVRVRPLGS